MATTYTVEVDKGTVNGEAYTVLAVFEVQHNPETNTMERGKLVASYSSLEQSFIGDERFFGMLKRRAVREGIYKLPETVKTGEELYVLVFADSGCIQWARVFKPEDQALADELYCEHVDMLEEDDDIQLMLAKVETTPDAEPRDPTWNIWTLSGGDIEEVFKRMDLDVAYEELDVDDVARNFKKGVESVLGSGFDWTDMLRDAINESLK